MTALALAIFILAWPPFMWLTCRRPASDFVTYTPRGEK